MTTEIFAVDPGSEQSAFVRYGSSVIERGTLPNADMLARLAQHTGIAQLVIEKIESYGMAVGVEIFDTVFWSGRFAQSWHGAFDRLPRRAIKLHLCGSPRAKDANIRQALLDRFGPGREKAIGTKKAPGPLYGFKADEWAALAVAVTWSDQNGV